MNAFYTLELSNCVVDFSIFDSITEITIEREGETFEFSFTQTDVIEINRLLGNISKIIALNIETNSIQEI